jgi:hypothetical protein
MTKCERTAPGAIVVYQFGKAPQGWKSRFTEKVLGADQKVRGKTYRRRGLLDEVAHWRVNRGTLVVMAADHFRVVRELRRWTQDVESWEITLTRRQVSRHRAGTRA